MTEEEALRQRLEKVEVENFKLRNEIAEAAREIDVAGSVAHRIRMLRASFAERATERNECLADLLGSMKLVMQVIDGGAEEADPDYECNYCGDLVSEGHTDHCIVPVARAEMLRAGALLEA